MKSILQRLIPNASQVQDPTVRTAYGKFSSCLGILCNFLLFAGKLVAGLLSGSLSITADAFNNLSDASSSVIGLLGFYMASRPADEDHPFGHGRYEYLSGLVVSLMILLIGFELLKSSVDKIVHPADVAFRWIVVAILIVSILAKLWLMAVNRRIGTLIRSQTLLVTAADSRNDVITTAAVLLTTLISHYTQWHLDGWMGLLVALFILYSGVGLVKETLDPLLGHAPDPGLVQSIHDRIMQYPGVLGTHDLMVHDYGPGRQFASVHVEMAAEADVLESHDVIDNIERDLRRDLNLHIVVHFDPISTKTSLTSDLRAWLLEVVREIDNRLTIHDLRVVTGTTHTNLIFDCVVPHDLSMSKSDLRKEIVSRVQEIHPTYHCVITFDQSYVAIQS